MPGTGSRPIRGSRGSGATLSRLRPDPLPEATGLGHNGSMSRLVLRSLLATLGMLLARASRRSAGFRGWSHPQKPVLPLPDPRFLLVGLLIARELGDDVTEKRLRDRDRRFREPTAEGVENPTLGIARAWNAPEEGALHVATYEATPSQRGAATSFRVTNLPHARDRSVFADGSEFPRWRALDDHSIAIDLEVGGADVPDRNPSTQSQRRGRRLPVFLSASREWESARSDACAGAPS